MTSGGPALTTEQLGVLRNPVPTEQEIGETEVMPESTGKVNTIPQVSSRYLVTVILKL